MTGGAPPPTGPVTAEEGAARSAWLAAGVVTQVVVPAALISCVTLFLHYLLDVRAVLLGPSFALKWISTCLVVASVLIVRYGATGANRERQAFYLAALAGATFLSMLVLSGRLGGLASGVRAPAAFVLNLVVVFGAWWLATALARQMSLDSEEAQAATRGGRTLKIWGEDYRAWRDARDRERAGDDAEPPPAPARKRARPENPWVTFFLVPWRAVTGPLESDPHGNPARGVARLALAALLVFAATEPLLMRGAPELGPRALGALFGFLLSVAVLLAAGSVVGTARHARAKGGRVSVGLLPQRVVLGGGFAFLLLVAALGAPFVHVHGTGEIAFRVPAAWST